VCGEREGERQRDKERAYVCRERARERKTDRESVCVCEEKRVRERERTQESEPQPSATHEPGNRNPSAREQEGERSVCV